MGERMFDPMHLKVLVQTHPELLADVWMQEALVKYL